MMVTHTVIIDSICVIFYIKLLFLFCLKSYVHDLVNKTFIIKMKDTIMVDSMYGFTHKADFGKVAHT